MRAQMVVLVALCSAMAQAQVAPMKAVLPFPRYKQMEGQLGEALPESGAKLCLLPGGDVCFTMPSHPYSVEGDFGAYEFGLSPKSERLQLTGGGSLIFFASANDGGGGSTLERLAVLRYEGDGKITNLLPYVTVAYQGNRAMWSVPDVSPYPVLLTANFSWAAGETRWDRHFYTVDAYRFNAARDAYVKCRPIGLSVSTTA